jgi:hypothetical protein
LAAIQPNYLGSNPDNVVGIAQLTESFFQIVHQFAGGLQ